MKDREWDGKGGKGEGELAGGGNKGEVEAAGPHGGSHSEHNHRNPRTLTRTDGACDSAA